MKLDPYWVAQILGAIIQNLVTWDLCTPALDPYSKEIQNCKAFPTHVTVCVKCHLACVPGNDARLKHRHHKFKWSQFGSECSRWQICLWLQHSSAQCFPLLFCIFNYSTMISGSGTTAWRVFRLWMEERLPIWMVAANISSKQSQTTEEGWSFSLGVVQSANNFSR